MVFSSSSSSSSSSFSRLLASCCLLRKKSMQKTNENIMEHKKALFRADAPCFFRFFFPVGFDGPPRTRLGQLFCRLLSCSFDPTPIFLRCFPDIPWQNPDTSLTNSWKILNKSLANSWGQSCRECPGHNSRTFILYSPDMQILRAEATFPVNFFGLSVHGRVLYIPSKFLAKS